MKLVPGLEIKIRVVKGQEASGDPFVVDIKVGQHFSMFAITSGTAVEQTRQIAAAIQFLAEEASYG
jgi:hypothetical protein